MSIFIGLTILLGVGMAALMVDNGDEDDGGAEPNIDKTELSDEDDSFEGDDSGDYIAGLLGNDQIDGMDGNDSLAGGDGDDLLRGGAGDDWLLGGDGNDSVQGNEGDDTISLGEGDDLYTSFDEAYGEGNGEYGNDLVRGGAGSDTLWDLAGENTLLGGLGDDVIHGGDYLDENTPDVLGGGYGDDTIYGDDGDTITGGAGVDNIGMAYDLGTDADPITITDLDTDSEEVLVFLGSPLTLASFKTHIDFDPETGEARISITGKYVNHNTQSYDAVPEETFMVLQNMTEESLANLKIDFEYD